MRWDAGPIDTHTPGPWKILTVDDGVRGIVVVAADPEMEYLPVAEIWFTCLKNEAANSRLIAEAPNLKTMLEEFIDIIESSKISGDCIAEVILARDKLRYIETGVDGIAGYIETSKAISDQSAEERKGGA